MELSMMLEMDDVYQPAGQPRRIMRNLQPAFQAAPVEEGDDNAVGAAGDAALRTGAARPTAAPGVPDGIFLPEHVDLVSPESGSSDSSGPPPPLPPGPGPPVPGRLIAMGALGGSTQRTPPPSSRTRGARGRGRGSSGGRGASSSRA